MFLKLLKFKRDLSSKKKCQDDLRTIYLNGHKPDFFKGPDKFKYSDNTIKTSKYTFLNFLFKNLFEQFRRIANFYFLLVIIIRFIITDSAINPYASLLPLTIVVTVTMIKQAYEDILRHRIDDKENNKKALILKDGKIKTLECKKIKCGDVVRVDENSLIPCDMALIYSSNSDKICYVTTANLDGESNLKIKKGSVDDCCLIDDDSITNFKGVVICDKPNAQMYDFKGKIITKFKEFPIDNQNLLLRGSCLKMTKFIYGCAIYTGKDTKMILNYKIKSNKISCVERQLNRSMIIFFILLAILTFVSFGFSVYYLEKTGSFWYLVPFNRINYINMIFDALSLYTPIIPLAMYVSVDFVRFIGKRFFEWDEEMYDEKMETCAIVNNTDVNENLGQIEYLFCDKTGTLTVNEMIFRQCYINGVLFEERNGLLMSLSSPTTAQLSDSKMSRFFEVLCLCHSIHIDSSNHEYQASSPDEYSFIKFCQKIGIIYKGESKTENSSQLIKSFQYCNTMKNYEVLHVLDFDSTRKRMSIIVRCMETQNILVLCKGAESSIFEKTISENVDLVNQQINEFAKLGWRTLAIAYKEINQTELDSYDSILNDAYNDISSRSTKLSSTFDRIESNLILLGATGVEDKLQDECASTLELIREAGIKVWVLTGDKTETALNVSKSCRHFSNSMKNNFLVNIEKNDIRTKLKELLSIKENSNQSLVVDGKTLSFIFDESDLKKEFIQICLKCKAVLCCRMSPKQKAQIVRLVKKSPNKPITAAIGDGANDVSMIQEANVGIGIFGKEGRNASRSADFAFAKFRYLKKAILFHGILYYSRVAILVQYFFYKNIAFVLCQFYFSFYHAFSGQNLYHTNVINLYNVCLSSAPIIFYGLFEQRYNLLNLKRNSRIYNYLTKNRENSIIQLFKWIICGLWHSIVAYFSAYFLDISSSSNMNGEMIGRTSFGLLVTLNVLFIVHVKLILEWNYLSIMFVLGFLISFFLGFINLIIPSSFIMPYFLAFLTENQSLYWISYQLLSVPSVWLSILVTIVTAIIPDLIIKVIENEFRLNHKDNQKTVVNERKILTRF